MARRSFEYYLNILGLTLQSTKEDIRKAYYNLIKQWHPDKFYNDRQKNIEATEKSKIIIDAYDNLKNYQPFLTNKNPCTIRVKSSNIYSINYDNNKLQIKFLKGGVYEYYGVPENLFNEFMNASSKGKFARKYIYNNYRFKKIN